MSVEKLQLRKLLELFFLVGGRRDSRIREKIRAEIHSAFDRESGGGGDFHSPFWREAKQFAAGECDLRESIKIRIAQNRRRERLYRLLADGFMRWWNERRGWANAKFNIYPGSVRVNYFHPDVGGAIKIDNFLSVEIEDEACRHIYPYFSEKPALSGDSARIGLYIMKEAFPKIPAEELYILDVLRGVAYSVVDTPLVGNEREVFKANFEQLRSDWARLRAFYG